MILMMLSLLNSAFAATQADYFSVIKCDAQAQFVTYQAPRFWGDNKVIQSERQDLCLTNPVVFPADGSPASINCSNQTELNYGLSLDAQYSGNGKSATVAIQFGHVTGFSLDTRIVDPIINTLMTLTPEQPMTLESYDSLIVGRKSERVWTEVNRVVITCSMTRKR